MSDGSFTFRMERLPPLPVLAKLWLQFEQPANGSFFTTWCWIGTWLKTLPAGIGLLLLLAFRNGEPAGVAIGTRRDITRHLFVRARQLHFNSTGDSAFDCIFIEHNDFAGEAGSLEDFIRWFAQTDCEIDELILPGIDSIAGARVEGCLQHLHKQPAFSNKGLQAADGIGGGLSRNTRSQLARSMRQYEQAGELQIEEADSAATALEFFAALKELHVRSWTRRGKPHAFRHDYFETFHRALIREAFPNGNIQLLKISAGGVAIGYLYNFRHREKTYAYQSGFVNDSGDLRPGYVSHALAMQHNAARGIVEYDFLAGANQLKRSLGKNEYAMEWKTIAKPSTALRIEHAVRTLRSQRSS